MSFWDIFKTKETTQNNQSRLYFKLKELLPNAEENTLIYTACISGLMARLIHVDLMIKDSEVLSFKKVLERNFEDKQLVAAITELALNEIQELIDLENQRYSQPLNDILNENEKYKVLQLLFEVAASDGVVENIESEEIRLVCKSLCLSDKYFLAARAEVKDKLGALNK